MQLLDNSVDFSKMWLTLFTGDGLWWSEEWEDFRGITDSSFMNILRKVFPTDGVIELKKDSIRFVSDFS